MALVFTWYAYGYYEPFYTFFGGYWFNFIDSLVGIARLLYKKPSDFSSETAVSVHIHHHLVRIVLALHWILSPYSLWSLGGQMLASHRWEDSFPVRLAVYPLIQGHDDSSAEPDWDPGCFLDLNTERG